MTVHYDTPPVHRTTGKGQPPRTVGQRAKPVEARKQMRNHEVVESCGRFMMMLRNLKKVLALSGFVKKSAKLSCEATKGTRSLCSSTHSRT